MAFQIKEYISGYLHLLDGDLSPQEEESYSCNPLSQLIMSSLHTLYPWGGGLPSQEFLYPNEAKDIITWSDRRTTPDQLV
jgi:hypothetical protein